MATRPDPQSAQLGAPGPGRNSPHLPQRQMQFSEEERRVLQECNTESFWYRCVPLAMAFGGTTWYLVKTGHLKPHPRFGPALKTSGAVCLAYVVGKLSYYSTCQQKILERLPYSNIAKAIRKSQGKPALGESELDNDSGQDALFTPQTESLGREPGDNVGGAYDSGFRNRKDVDDGTRFMFDKEGPQRDEAGSDPNRTLTYAELRQRNRQDFDRSSPLSSNHPFRQRPFPPPEPSRPQTSLAPPDSDRVDDLSPPPTSRKIPLGRTEPQKKNIYGDAWDSN